MNKIKNRMEQIDYGGLFLVLVGLVTIVISVEALIDSFRWHLLGKKYCKKCGARLSCTGFYLTDFKALYDCPECKDDDSEVTKTTMR